MKIQKRIASLLFALLLWAAAVLPVSAADLPRLVDDADLLTDHEEAVLLSELDEISERQRMDIVVVTTDSLEGKSAMEYADDFYDYNGYGFGNSRDGVLLLISMEDRDWWLSTTGNAIIALTDAGIDYIADRFLPELSDGDYADAFSVYAQLCDEFITQAKTGAPYDVGNMPKEPFEPAWVLFFSIVVGIAVAAAVTGSMKRQLRTVRFQRTANRFVREGSMNVTESQDTFLDMQVYRSEKPRKEDSDSGGSSTHTSSSGTTHGGSGGKF